MMVILFIIIVLLLGIMTSFDEDFKLKNTNFLVKHHAVLHYPLEPKWKSTDDMQCPVQPSAYRLTIYRYANIV